DLGFDLRDHGLAGFVIGHVAFGSDEIETGLLLLGKPIFLLRETRQTVGDDLHAVLGQRLADCRAQAAHGAGDECDFLSHFESFCCSSIGAETPSPSTATPFYRETVRHCASLRASDYRLNC